MEDFSCIVRLRLSNEGDVVVFLSFFEEDDRVWKNSYTYSGEEFFAHFCRYRLLPKETLEEAILYYFRFEHLWDYIPKEKFFWDIEDAFLYYFKIKELPDYLEPKKKLTPREYDDMIEIIEQAYHYIHKIETMNE